MFVGFTWLQSNHKLFAFFLNHCYDCKGQWPKHDLFSFWCFTFPMDSNVEGERAQKVARLSQMRRSLPHMSSSAMAALLKDIKDSGLPAVIGKKKIKEARSLAISQAEGPFGPLVQSFNAFTKDGKAIAIDILPPLVFISHAYSQPGGLYNLLDKKVSREAMHNGFKVEVDPLQR